MKPITLLVLPLIVVLKLAGQPASEPVEISKRGFHLDLLPKAFTPNPTIEMTVYSEITVYGRTLPQASPDRSVYYLAQDEGFKPMGAPTAGEHPPPSSEIERRFREALATGGFLAAEDKRNPPALVLIFFWGSHSALDADQYAEFPDLRHQSTLERATLVGGPAFSHKLWTEFEYGQNIPLYSAKDDYLRRQVANDLYYVVISAYAFNDVAKGHRQLAWRTTMTVSAQGVSMAETLSPLILTGAPYIGRNTGESVALRRDIRRGSVKLGPLRIIEDDISLPTDTPDAALRK